MAAIRQINQSNGTQVDMRKCEQAISDHFCTIKPNTGIPKKVNEIEQLAVG
jgi:hypothetical protein